MVAAPRELGARHGSSPRRVVVLAAALGFVAVLMIGVLDAGRRVSSLEHRRDEALAARADPADVAGDVAGAFRRFRETLAPGDRFALVFGDDVEPDRAGFYRLVALSYLYPAVATSDATEADAVMAFGGPPSSRLAGFEQVDVVDGVWLGRRQR